LLFSPPFGGLGGLNFMTLAAGLIETGFVFKWDTDRTDFDI
jgi:hypothetical protein